MDGYLQNTMHGVLNCKCKGNCILKSLHVDELYNNTAFITVEPYDDAFNQNQVDDTVERIKRILLKRNKAIYKSLNVSSISVTVYDQWTMKDAFVVDFRTQTITGSVN